MGSFPALVLFGINLTIAFISNVLGMQFVIRTGNMEIRPWVKRFLTTRLKIKNKKAVPWWWLLITRGYHYKKGIIDTMLVFWIAWIGCSLGVVVQVRLRLRAVPLFSVHRSKRARHKMITRVTKGAKGEELPPSFLASRLSTLAPVQSPHWIRKKRETARSQCDLRSTVLCQFVHVQLKLNFWKIVRLVTVI